MIKKILFPTDGSRLSRKVLDYVKDLATRYHAEVIAVYVYDSPVTLTAQIMTPQMVKEFDDTLMEGCNSFLHDVEKELAGHDFSYRCELLKGNTYEKLKEIISKEEVDIIVMGRQNMGKLQSVLLGSVSTHMLHNAKCPVLFIHE